MPKSSRWLKGIVAGVIAVLIGFTFHIWWNTHKTTRASITQGLVAYWSFDRNSVTGMRVNDMSGNGNDGTLTNSPNLVKGKIGQALQLDEANSFMDAGLKSSLSNLHALTFSAWIYPQTLNSVEHIVDKGGANNSGWMINFEANARLQFLAYFTNGSTERTSDYNLIEQNVWQHIVVTWDGSAMAANVKMYLNGSEMANRATFDGRGSRKNDAAYHLYIGDATTLSPFYGLIDEVRIYNRVLSTDEIQRLYTMVAEHTGD